MVLTRAGCARCPSTLTCWCPTPTLRCCMCGTQTPSPTAPASRWVPAHLAVTRAWPLLQPRLHAFDRHLARMLTANRQHCPCAPPAYERHPPTFTPASPSPSLAPPPAEHQRQAAVGGRPGSGGPHRGRCICPVHQLPRPAGGQRRQGHTRELMLRWCVAERFLHVLPCVAPPCCPVVCMGTTALLLHPCLRACIVCAPCTLPASWPDEESLLLLHTPKRGFDPLRLCGLLRISLTAATQCNRVHELANLHRTVCAALPAQRCLARHCTHSVATPACPGR